MPMVHLTVSDLHAMKVGLGIALRETAKPDSAGTSRATPQLREEILGLHVKLDDMLDQIINGEPATTLT